MNLLYYRSWFFCCESTYCGSKKRIKKSRIL